LNLLKDGMHKVTGERTKWVLKTHASDYIELDHCDVSYVTQIYARKTCTQNL